MDSKNIIRFRNVNRMARQIVTLALKKNFTYEEMAQICNVSVGSIKRWMQTGRADASKIIKLEQEIGFSYLTPDVVGDILIDIYRKRSKRYRITRNSLKKISGRSALRLAFVDRLILYLLDRGYYLLEASHKEEDLFIVIRMRQLLNYVNDNLENTGIKSYYRQLSDDIDLIDEE